MLLLVHKGLGTLDKYDLPNIGRLLSPRQYSRARDTAESGRPWAADNDAFLAWDEVLYMRMLETIAGLAGCLFVTAPDVVGDARATRYLWDQWAHRISDYGLPVGFVAQDGCQRVPVDADVLFIGGTTQFKMSAEAGELARKFDGWTHMGRVNSWRRLQYAMSLGVDSIDGTGLSRYTDAYIEQWSEYASSPSQGGLF